MAAKYFKIELIITKRLVSFNFLPQKRS